MKIKQLSNTTINRIAAGEVIERPASVIKELTENAIDANATKIDITVERSGKNLIVITDNGMGMSKADLNLAVERHTTSKLFEDDIMNIRHMGFRGEALPSIASISRLTITTREKGSETSFKIFVEGGLKFEIEEDIFNIGTKVEVRDLFFATPARLKFLKTDQTELSACVDVVKKLAMSHPHVAFSFTSQDKVLLKTRAIDRNEFNSHKFRIQEILGNSFIENAIEVKFNNRECNIHGFVSLPTFNKAGQQDQFLFVNNRPVKDKLLLTAVRVAYQDYLARDRHPVIVLYLNINPEFVDVNVHPAKAEVRFHDSNSVRSIIIRAIKEALSEGAAFKASSSIADNAIKFFNSSNKSTLYQATSEDYKYSDKTSHQNINTNPLRQSNTFFETKTHYRNIGEQASKLSNNQENSNQQIENFNIKNLITQIAPQAKAFSALEETQIPQEEQNFPLGAACAHLHENYIISQTKDSIIIIDQHAAHERLLYEKLKIAIEKNGLARQRLLIPEVVELNDQFLADILNNNKTKLAQLGLIIDRFGEKSIIVSETPALLGEINTQELIKDLADNLFEEGENISLTQLIESVTETFACHNAVRSGKKINIHEANSLLRQMEQTPFSGQCNHGRPTYIELKLKDIEKLFGRS
jgi:DNA mismatch repair protein MutL